MNEEEKKAIEDMNRFANGIDMSCVTARQMQIILNLIEKKENCINILDDELKERNKTINEKEIIIEKLQKENEELNLKYSMLYAGKIENMKAQEVKIKSQVIPVQKVKDILEQKDKIIELMADDIHGTQVECNRYFKDKEDVKQYFKNKAKELLNK